MNARCVALLAGDVDRWPLAGDQVYVDLDLGDENLPPGARLRVGSVLVEVSAKPHTGCSKFSARFGPEALAFVNSETGRRCACEVSTPGWSRVAPFAPATRHQGVTAPHERFVPSSVRANARIQPGHTRGRSRSPSDGSRVAFLRTPAGDDPHASLWVYDVADDREREIFEGPPEEGHVTDAERDRRERMRERQTGVVTYAADPDLTDRLVRGGSTAARRRSDDRDVPDAHRRRAPPSMRDPIPRVVASPTSPTERCT